MTATAIRQTQSMLAWWRYIGIDRAPLIAAVSISGEHLGRLAGFKNWKRGGTWVNVLGASCHGRHWDPTVRPRRGRDAERYARRTLHRALERVYSGHWPTTREDHERNLKKSTRTP